MSILSRVLYGRGFSSNPKNRFNMGRNKSGKKNFKQAKEQGGLAAILTKHRTWGGTATETDKRNLYNSRRKNNK